MTTVAFIGLGIMGAPMAKNLLTGKLEVIGYNRSPGKVEDLIAAGGRTASSIAEAARVADVVITMLPDSPDVEQVMLGPEGVFEVARPGTLIIDMSTVRPDLAVALAGRGKDSGLHVLDAPVSGGQPGAENATLSIMVGGELNDFETARPILERMGKTVVYVGPAGSGQTVKAANQLIVAGNIQLVAEALVFLEAHHVDLVPALEVLAGGLAGSTVLQQKAPMMMSRDYRPGFRLELHHKDMGIVQNAAREAGVVLPLAAAVAQLVMSTVKRGFGGDDHSALHRLAEMLSGRAE